MAPTPRPLTLIVAATTTNLIGSSSTLPWRLPREMAYFARVTKSPVPGSSEAPNAVIMGRKSWDGIPGRWRPLAERVNVVVTRQEGLDLGGARDTLLAPSLPAAVELLNARPIGRAFLIGGAQLYALALAGEVEVERMLVTRIKTAFEGDAWFPQFEGEWRRARHEELEAWVGFEVERGEQKETDRNSGREVVYEFQMWVR